jgi:hypothetical protein
MGGYDNVLLPAYAAAAILFGIVFAAALDRIHRGQMARPGLAASILYGVCLAQFALLAYDPRGQLPRKADRIAGERLLDLIADVPGEVLIPSHGYLPVEVGKASNAHLMQVFDVLQLGDEHSARLADQFRSAIRDREFGAIILDNRNYYFMAEIDASYVLQSTVFSEPGVFLPVTGGLTTRPEYLYVPRPAGPDDDTRRVQQRVRDALRQSWRRRPQPNR